MKPKRKRNLKKRCRHAVATWATCACAWYFDFTWNGKAERGSLQVSKLDEAEKKFAIIKAEIMNGTYVAPRAKAVVPVVTEIAPTFEMVAGFYLTQHVEPKLCKGAAAHHASLVKFLGTVILPLGMPFTAKAFKDITQEDVEIAIAAKRTPTTAMFTKNGKSWMRTTGGPVAANRMHAHLGALWAWAIQRKRGYATASPFSDGGRVPDELKKPQEQSRDRRLHPGEEDALLTHAGPHLHDCIVTALETGMRKNEILSLQWKHVRWMQNEIALAPENTKTKMARQIPISPALRTLLVRRKADHPKDQEWTPEDYVFGNEIGERVKDIRTAFDNTVLKAHGVKVARGHAGRVSAENRAKLAEIDLHFHDLRHEAGSRKLETPGWQIHDVSKWLGHTKLTTTDTYLNTTTRRLHELNERVPLTLVR